MAFVVDEDPAELCVVRRSQTVADLEHRLQFAMVAYVGGARRELALARVPEILAGKLDIPPELVSMHRHRPEDFLVIFASADIRNRVAACPSVEYQGDRLIFRLWNRQSQAVHSLFGFKVWLELEGIPPHAWDRSVVEQLLGTSCKVDAVALETASRADLSSFRVTAWTSNPQDIPTLRWLAVLEPGKETPPALLQYKVLVHIDSMMDLREAGEPWFMGGSSDSGHSGLPDSGGDLGGSGPRTRRLVWQFGVRDVRGGGHGNATGGGAASGGGVWSRPAGSDWRLPPMAPAAVDHQGAPTMTVCDRLARRTSAFLRLTGQSARADSNGTTQMPNSNQLGAERIEQLARPIGPTRDYSDLIRRKGVWQASVLPSGATADSVVQSAIAAAPNATGQIVPGSLVVGLDSGDRSVPLGPLDPGARPVGQTLALLADPHGSDKQAGSASQDKGNEECAAPRIPCEPAGAPREAGDQCMGAQMVADQPISTVLADPNPAAALAPRTEQTRPGKNIANTEPVHHVAPPDDSLHVLGRDDVIHATPPLVHGTQPCNIAHEPLSELQEMMHDEEELAAEPTAATQPEISRALVIANDGMTPQEAIAYARLKSFCKNIVKKLAPPLLREVQASSLRPDAEPFTPRRTTRATKRAASNGASKPTKVENVLLRALGLILEDMVADDVAVQELRDLFDSPLREQHVRVIAALFGKCVPDLMSSMASGAAEIGVQ